MRANERPTFAIRHVTARVKGAGCVVRSGRVIAEMQNAIAGGGIDDQCECLFHAIDDILGHSASEGGNTLDDLAIIYEQVCRGA